MNVIQVLILLDKLLMMAERAPAIYNRIKAIKDEMERIGDRELTDEEWEEVGERVDGRLAFLEGKLLRE